MADGLTDWLTTTDHKRIGLLYIGTAFVFFLIGGLIALAMRAELAQPGMQFIDAETYDQLFTMHGTMMMLLFGTPVAVGPRRTTCCRSRSAPPDMAFPRLNALTYWMFLFGGLIVLSGFLPSAARPTPAGPSTRRSADATYSPGVGHGPVDRGHRPDRHLVDPRRGQLHGHDLHAAARRA